MSKLDNQKATQDIIINNNQNVGPSKPCNVSQGTQTDVGECYNCNSTDITESNLRAQVPPHHAETEAYITHQSRSSPLNSEFSQTCTECGRKFSSIQHLVEHRESEHASGEALSCTFCSYKCKSETHLTDHIEALHMELDCTQNEKNAL